MPTPAIRVTLDGRDLTDRIAPRLLDLTLTEQRGDEADQLDLRIHDHDGRMDIPNRGAEISVAIGWKGQGLVDKGLFRVDEVEHAGAPDVITLRARSADFSAQLRIRRERSFDATTLGAIVQAIAADHGLTPRIAPALASVAIAHVDQTESDGALLARLGKTHDAVSTIKRRSLLFLPIGQGLTAAGAPLPAVTIARADGDQHRYHLADRDTYNGVRAFWHDQDGANRKSVLVGQSGNAKRLRETFANEADARAEAQAEWQRIQRGVATLAYTLALGRPDLYPEQRVTARGFKPAIDQTAWLIVKVDHRLTPGGFTTGLDLETVSAAAAAEDESDT